MCKDYYFDSFNVISDVISCINGEQKDVDFASFTGKITAVVKGKKLFEDKEIKVQLTKDSQEVIISVFWEDVGIKDYKQMGLYGIMDIKYYKAINNNDGSFSIIDKERNIKIVYK